MYTLQFLEAQDKVKKLELKFEANPCKKTATPLTKARVELEKINKFHLKFTQEFRIQKQKEDRAELIEYLSIR